LKLKNLAKIPMPGSGSQGMSPINKLKEIHYDILQVQEQYLNNEDDPIEIGMIRDLFKME
jgi:hypothetical protein